MAAPVDAARVGTSITTAATSHAINVGSPSSGDLLVLHVRYTGNPGTVTFTGYTEIGFSQADASDDRSGVYYRLADGAEGTDDALSTGNSVKIAATCWRVTGAENPGTSAPTISTVATGTTSANTADPSSVAPADAPQDTLYIAMAGGDGESSYTAAPTDYGNLTTANTGTAGAVATNAFIGGASRQITASSSDDPGTFTHGAHANGWMAWAVAIRGTASAAVKPKTLLSLGTG